MTTTTPSPAPVAVNDIGSTEEILAAVDETIKYFDDGDIVEGTVVKVDRDDLIGVDVVLDGQFASENDALGLVADVQ